jgi:hypothetical protein
VTKRFGLLLLSLVIVGAAVVAPTASASPRILKGMYDDGNLLYGNPDVSFRQLEQLNTKIVRINLHWGGRWGVAGRFPTVRPADPNDGQYNWELYDRAVIYADQHGMQVVFSIVSTPAWANGGRGPNVAPTRMVDLRQFAHAAALRYAGGFKRPSDGMFLPAVRHWIAWNEPNNPAFLFPQAQGNRFVSPRTYAQICNAIVTGVKSTRLPGRQVACGVTAPRGNNMLRSTRPSMAPIAFLRMMRAAGARGFDAYAHHPYYGNKRETPSTRPAARTAVTLGNINVLDAELRRLYGRPVRIWITEYGYQTPPPNDVFAVTRAQQAAYMRQAWNIAKRHPRIDMFVWFLLKDDTRAAGWQSGLMTSRGARKPSWGVFRALR